MATDKIKTKHRQAFLAKRIGVKQGTISMWLNLKVRPTGLTKASLLQHYPELHDKIEAAWNTKTND